MLLNRSGEVLHAEIIEYVRGAENPWFVEYEDGARACLTDSELTHAQEVAEILTEDELAAEYAASARARQS